MLLAAAAAQLCVSSVMAEEPQQQQREKERLNMWNQWIICDHKIKEYLMEIGNWCWHYAMTGICTQHRDMQSLQGH